jgi:hypothetical protein
MNVKVQILRFLTFEVLIRFGTGASTFNILANDDGCSTEIQYRP